MKATAKPGSRLKEYINYINCMSGIFYALVQQLYVEEGVGFVDLWGCCVLREDMLMRLLYTKRGGCLCRQTAKNG